MAVKKSRARHDPEDPQKGRWGGLPERNGRVLSAKVKHAGGQWYDVRLKVAATTETKLKGTVVFHLHDTFAPQNRVVAVRNGRAALGFYAWGAFTVGAEADAGKTRLELDLSELSGIPAGFLDN